VENQRPLLRSTSSGYTVYIDAVGRIHPGSPEPYTAGYTVARVPLPEKQLTVYTRWGDWFPLFCGLVCGLAVFILVIMKNYSAGIKKPNEFKHPVQTPQPSILIIKVGEGLFISTMDDTVQKDMSKVAFSYLSHWNKTDILLHIGLFDNPTYKVLLAVGMSDPPITVYKGHLK